MKPTKRTNKKGKRTSKRATRKLSRKPIRFKGKAIRNGKRIKWNPRTVGVMVPAEVDNGEAIAEQDFNNEIKLAGWKAINKTWTKGKVARFKASAYVKNLQGRIKELKKKVVVFS